MQENVNPMWDWKADINPKFLETIFYRSLRIAFFLQKTEIHIYNDNKFSQILKIYLSKTSFLASNLMALEQNVVCWSGLAFEPELPGAAGRLFWFAGLLRSQSIYNHRISLLVSTARNQCISIKRWCFT